MPDAFVPLMPATSPSGSGDSFRACILAQAGSRPAFQPVTASSVPAGGSTDHVHSTTTDLRPPVVTLRREGDRVIGIHIVCSCGQVIELACS